mgnify:FL=1
MTNSINHMETRAMQVIARVHTPFAEKFGVPRQSGLAPTAGQIIFEPPYRNPDALRGIEGFSHLWLVWVFDRAERDTWSPTVRPPRLGGNARMGVFATRSPFRPNPIGLSCVQLKGVEWETPEGPVLHIQGADLVDGTPLLDIKPYLPYCDAKPDAAGAFTDTLGGALLTVDCAAALLERLPPEDRSGLLAVLANDPRPRYQKDPQRVYGLTYAGHNVTFRVTGDTLLVEGIE